MGLLKNLITELSYIDKHGVNHISVIDEDTDETVDMQYELSDDVDEVTDPEGLPIQCEFCGCDIVHKGRKYFCPNCEAEYLKKDLEEFIGGPVKLFRY